MGFGLLFIGYFFLVNLFYPAYTDIIGALILLLALYRLVPVNRGFRITFLATAVFALFAAAELGIVMAQLFWPFTLSAVGTVTVSAARAVLVGALTFLLLTAIREVAREVGLRQLAGRCSITRIFPCVLYTLTFLAEIPGTLDRAGAFAASLLSLLLVVLSLVMIFLNLITIYTAYMRICMPTEAERKSRGGLLDKMRMHQQSRQQEYEEYKRNRRKKKEVPAQAPKDNGQQEESAE